MSAVSSVNAADTAQTLAPHVSGRTTAEQEAYVNELVRRVMVTTAAIVRAVRADHNGIPYSRVLRNLRAWRRSISGTIPCPICAETEQDGLLHYIICGFNGHLHVQCDRPECVRWNE